MQAEITIPTWARRIVSDHTDMDRAPHPVDAGKVRSFRLNLPDDVYFEYAFIDENERMRADPANPVRAENPWYPEVSAITGPRYRPSPYASPPAASGVLDRHRLESRCLDGMRRVNVYTPPGLGGETLPLILVHDGVAFLRVGRLDGVLDALMAEGRVRPARLAFLEPVDRFREYSFSPAHRDFVLDELVPLLARQYPGTGEVFAMGASLGGLASACLALAGDGTVSALATFSGAFLGSPAEPDFYRSTSSWVLARLRERQALDLPWYAEVGTIEWLTGVNRELRAELERLASPHAYTERNAGHNWVNWRNGLAAGLEFLLAP